MRDAFGIEKSFRGASTFRAIELSGDAAGKAKHLKTLAATRGRGFGTGKPAKWPKRSMSRADYTEAARAARVKASATKKAQEAAAGKKAAAPKEKSTRWGPSNNQAAWMVGGTATAAGGTYASHRLSKADDRKRKKGAIAAGAVAGVGGAKALDEGSGWAAKRAIDAYQKPRWTEGHKKILAQHRDAVGASGKPVAAMSGKQKSAFFEKYPRNVPGGTARRVLAYSNRNASRVGVLATGAVVGGGLAARRQKVEKGLPSYLRNTPKALLSPGLQRRVRLHEMGQTVSRGAARAKQSPPKAKGPAAQQMALFERSGPNTDRLRPTIQAKGFPKKRG